MQGSIALNTSAHLIANVPSRHDPRSIQDPSRSQIENSGGPVFPEGLEACAHLHMSQKHLA
jgi:hypothetical protein